MGTEKRTTGVARIDGGIGLDEVVIGSTADHTPLGADDPGCNGLRQSKGVAYGHDPFADLKAIAVAQFGKGEFLLLVDLDQCQVQLFVHPLDLTLYLTPLGKLDQYLVGAVDYMVVGEDIAVGADDETAAQALFAARALLRHLIEELAEEIIEEVITWILGMLWVLGMGAMHGLPGVGGFGGAAVA